MHQPMIDYCLENNIITHKDIKYTVQAQLIVQSDYYNMFIDKCYNELPEDLVKLSVNSMIGNFKPNVDKHLLTTSICITSDSREAMYQHIQNNSTFIKTFEIEGKDYFHVFKDVKNIKMETEAPIYEQIVQIETIELHKLAKLIESKGGIVLDLCTDKIICNFPDDILPFELEGDNLKGYYFDDDETVLKYKIEHKNDRLRFPKMDKYRRCDRYTYEKQPYNLYEDVKDNNFTPLVNTILQKEQSFNILGPAGSGKSFLIKQLQEELTNQNKKFISLAPTNKAALIINGITLHKFVKKLKTSKAIEK